MSRVAESIMRGARQLAAYTQGDASQVKVYRVRVPNAVNVRKLRRQLKLSQWEFSLRFGFSVATVRDWEQKRRTPDGAARVLLTVIDKEPAAVRRALAKAAPKHSRKAG